MFNYIDIFLWFIQINLILWPCPRHKSREGKKGQGEREMELSESIRKAFPCCVFGPGRWEVKHQEDAQAVPKFCISTKCLLAARPLLGPEDAEGKEP